MTRNAAPAYGTVRTVAVCEPPCKQPIWWDGAFWLHEASGQKACPEDDQ